MAKETKSKWWNDSADFEELEEAISSGAIGITTNPVLVCKALYDKPQFWAPYVEKIDPSLSTAEKTEELIKKVTVTFANRMLPFFEQGNDGYVCAQVDPSKASNRESMLEMARRLHSWAPNISVKLPVTAAGLDVLEECAAEGITVTATVSFTLPQVLAVAERYQKGLERCKKANRTPGKCYAVIMVGRIDDYVRDVINDSKIPGISESDIIQCGSAIMKRAIKIFKEKKYEAILMSAGKRGAYQVSDLSGADITMSIHPKIQKLVSTKESPYEQEWSRDVEADVIKRLSACPEFVRAYEPDGMKPEEFITFGVVQKTLAQFTDSWTKIGQFKI